MVLLSRKKLKERRRPTADLVPTLTQHLVISRWQLHRYLKDTNTSQDSDQPAFIPLKPNLFYHLRIIISATAIRIRKNSDVNGLSTSPEQNRLQDLQQ